MHRVLVGVNVTKCHNAPNATTTQELKGRRAAAKQLNSRVIGTIFCEVTLHQIFAQSLRSGRKDAAEKS
jgi:Na+/phosphate symporter